MKIKSLLSLLSIPAIVSVPVATIASCSGTSQAVKITNIELTSPADFCPIGTSIQIQAKILPENATNKNLKWKVSDESLATINNYGYITGLKSGNVEITATADDGSGVSKTITLPVKNQPVQAIYIGGNSNVTVGSMTQYTAVVDPSSATIKNVTWSVTDLSGQPTSLAIIDQTGMLSASQPGEIYVKATAQDESGVSATHKVTIKAVPAKYIVISAPDVELYDNETLALSATVLPKEALIKTVKWTSSDPEIASIDSNGLITAKKPGKVEITALWTEDSSVFNKIDIYVSDHNTIETWEDYIFNRTFSIQATGIYLEEGKYYQGYSTGTAWILRDNTPQDKTDYKYRIATNWHVQAGFDSLKAKSSSESFKIRFGNKKSGDLDRTTDDYTEFDSSQYNSLNVKYSWYDGSDTTQTIGSETKTGKKGIDFHLADVDFAKVATSTTENDKLTKSKLDKLNADIKPITILPTSSDTNHFENKHLYTAGYPVQTSNNAKWEYHDLNQNQTEEGKPVPLKYVAALQHPHWCDFTSSPLTDCSPQYAFAGSSTDYLKNWMRGGASGSMLVGNFGTDQQPKYRPIGIYWGGLGYDQDPDEYIQPYFSIFKSDWKDYTAF